MKKKCAFVTGGTSNQLFAMAVLAINISKICPEMADELVVFTDKEIDKAEQARFQKIFPTRFIVYRSPFANMDNLNEGALRNFSKMVFCKYECFKLLNEYESVIWTDYDVVIKKDFSEILQRDNSKSEQVHAKFLSSDTIIAGKFSPSLYWHDCTKVLSEMNILHTAISTGLFVLIDSFPNFEEFYEKCISMTEKYAAHLRLPEEGVISVLFDKSCLKWENLPLQVYACHPLKNAISADTKILHAASHPKFWEEGLENNDWNKNYDEWVHKYEGKSRIKQELKIKRWTKYFLPYGFVKLLRW
ncbi:MAG: glycosyltransferase family 8 protein [Treponema sp.]|nr:glycosyltransferase family 8 protein [Treponema sp.]